LRRRTKAILGLAGLGIILVASLEISLAWADPASTLGLGLSANHTIPAGSNLTIRLSLTNGLPWPNPGRITADFPNLPGGLPFGRSAFFDYLLPVVPSSCQGFPSGYIPAFIAIYNRSGNPQVLTDAPLNIFVSSCPALPSNGLCYCYWFAPFQTKAESISVGGVWHSTSTNEPWINATYSRFATGNYTIIAFDEWGQIAEQNFTVIG
jgi:hypothetical protein